jgi:hypothetical protein
MGREPERAAQAVEEVLRHEPITPFTARILTAEVAFRDVVFPKDTVVMVCSFTGNRDGAGDPGFDIAADRPISGPTGVVIFFALALVSHLLLRRWHESALAREV